MKSPDEFSLTNGEFLITSTFLSHESKGSFNIEFARNPSGTRQETTGAGNRLQD